MKIFGSLSRLVSVVFRKDSNDISLQPNSGSYSGSTTMYLPPKLSGSDVMVAETTIQTLTNKTMSGSSNTFSNIAYASLSLSNSIVNADIAAGAAISYSKLALSNSIVNADIAAGAAIAYSKLNLSNSIVNADIAAGAAIAYSKLNLSASIVNADIASGANIDASKLGTGVVDNTEFNYLNGVTSGIQGQLDGMFKLAGRSGGQSAFGDTANSGNLFLGSTSASGVANKGYIGINDGSAVLIDPSATFAQASLMVFTGGNAELIVAGTPDSGGNMSFANTGDDGNFIKAFNSGGTFASPVATVSGSDLLNFAIRSWSTSGDYIGGQKPVANVIAYASEDHTTTYGSGFLWKAALNGSTSRTERLRLEGNGSTILGDATVSSGAHLLWAADGSGSIGASGANRPDSAYIKTSAFVANLSLSGNSLQSTNSNGDINLDPNGTGFVVASAAHVKLQSGTSASELRFYEPSGSGTNYSAFKAQAQAGDVTYTLPAADATSPGYVLSSDGAGALSWVSNSSVTSYKTDWTAVDLSPVTFDNTTDKASYTAHGLVNGQSLYFTVSGGSMPTGLSANTIYYVVNKSANDFQLAATKGGSAIDFTTNGSGTITAHITSIYITHNLNSLDVDIQAYDKSDGQTIEFDAEYRDGVNTLLINASEQPGGSGWRVMVLSV